ncbi:MAG: sensor histidine kinase response regulator [Chthoniobacter sp.]|nr:sensor histidine kinase response regulator [Chthoniobacter sp.]
MALLPPITQLYAAGTQRELNGGGGVSPEGKNAAEEFESGAARVQARLEQLKESEVRALLLEQFGVLRRTVTDLRAGIEALASETNPARYATARAKVEAQYAAVLASYQQFHNRGETIEDLLFAAHESAAATFLTIEYIVAGTLLVLLLVAAFYFRSRAKREHAMLVEKEQLLEKVREAEMKYRSIFDNSVEGIFQTTPEGRFVTANRALARMYGYESPEQLMEQLTDISSQLYVEPSQRDALLAALKQADVVSNFEFEVLRADGRTIWVRENVHAVRDAEGHLLFMEGTVEDVSDLWWGEQRRRLQYATARALAEAASVDEARPQLLRTICETLEWAMGAVWDVDPDAEVMQCVEVWHVPHVDITEFEAANAETEIRWEEGLAGEVWASGESKWIADLHQAVGYKNAQLALKCGMSSAFAVPIHVSGRVLHVFEFFSPKIALPDPELLQTLGTIGTQLGHLIERKHAEEALRKSEMRKAAILQSALDSIITFDSEGRIVEFNPAAERAFGYRQAEVLDREVSSLLFPDLRRRTGEAGAGLFEMVNEGAFRRRREIVATRADGSQFPVELAVSRIIINERPMFTAFVRDTTERKEAERLTSELALVVANSNDAIIACTIDGMIRSWNRGAEHIFGYTAEEAIGRPFHMLIPPDRLDEFPQALTAVKRGDNLANYETVRLRKDGKKIHVSLTDSPIRGADGQITGLSSIARDVTERKRLEEDLLQSQKMDAVGRLAGGIAHDFNNILTAILGYSDLIIGQIDERQWMYKHLSEIRKAADFAASLTHQLLAFSRRQPLFLRVFSINDTVNQMEKMLRRVIGEHIQIVTELNAEIGRLKADSGQLEQVLLNLCVNARDAMPRGGTMTISTADVTYFLEDFYSVNEMPAGEYVKLSVTDTGTGIPADVKKHIFEPFFTTKDKGQGTGLGLATCYGIVKQSGGYITVDSTVGVGTSFSVYLPRVNESGEKSTIRKEVGQLPGGNETVLYVEDEITVRSLTSHILRRLGYTILEASGGKEARDLLEANGNQRVDLLFSDVVLPDSGGSEIADWIKQRNASSRILFTSGYVDENILQRHGLEAGAAFLQKPFTPAELAKKVREVLDASPG